MNAHYWIIGQMMIDIILVGLLLWFVKFQPRGKRLGSEGRHIFQNTDSILREMQEISKNLDQNLEEKRDLSRHILAQLDDALSKAEETYEKIRTMTGSYPADGNHHTIPVQDAEKTKSSVRVLLKKGLSKQEIANCLDISLDEMELLIKLDSHGFEDMTPKNP